MSGKRLYIRYSLDMIKGINFNIDVRFTGGRPAGSDIMYVASWIDVWKPEVGRGMHACMMCKRSMMGLNLRRNYRTCMGEIQ